VCADVPEALARDDAVVGGLVERVALRVQAGEVGGVDVVSAFLLGLEDDSISRGSGMRLRIRTFELVDEARILRAVRAQPGLTLPISGVDGGCQGRRPYPVRG
jgi:hypothetical protein